MVFIVSLHREWRRSSSTSDTQGWSGGNGFKVGTKGHVFYYKLSVKYVPPPSKIKKKKKRLKEVRRGEYWWLGVFMLQYFPVVKI